MNEAQERATAGPLTGLRVVEVGQLIAGPFCGQLLGDLGADVIKIELPGSGDPMRQWGIRGEQEDSLWWSVIARNKRSVTLDLRKDAGAKIFKKLVGAADVLVENFRPGTMERWNLAPEDLQKASPDLIIARVSGFGQDGPYAPRAGYGSIGEAVGGMRGLNGFPDMPPPRMGISIGDSLAGLMATIGVLASLVAQGQRPRAQVVDVSIFESVLAVMESVVVDYASDGFVRPRFGTALPGIAPSNLYETRDGVELLIAANQDSVFMRLCEAMNATELASDPRFATHRARGENQLLLDEIVGNWVNSLDAHQVMALVLEHGIPATPIYYPPDIVRDEHFWSRGALIRVDDARHGNLVTQGVFPKLSETPGGVRWTGPRLGEHTEEVLLNVLDLTDDQIASLREDGIC